MLFFPRTPRFLISVFALVVALVICVPVYPSEEGDPVVIQVGNQTETLSQFDHQFEMAMVLMAIRDGIPNKSGVLIHDLRDRYLEARVTELLLLQQNTGYSIEVSDSEVGAEMADLAEQMRDIYGSGQADLSRQMEPLREYLREQLLVQKIKQVLIQDAEPKPSSAEESGYIVSQVNKFRENTVVHTWPDRLN